MEYLQLPSFQVQLAYVMGQLVIVQYMKLTKESGLCYERE